MCIVQQHDTSGNLPIVDKEPDDIPTELTEAMEMIRRLHLLPATQQCHISRNLEMRRLLQEMWM